MKWLFEFYNPYLEVKEIIIAPGDTWQQAWLEIIGALAIFDFVTGTKTIAPILRIEPYD